MVVVEAARPAKPVVQGKRAEQRAPGAQRELDPVMLDAEHLHGGQPDKRRRFERRACGHERADLLSAALGFAHRRDDPGDSQKGERDEHAAIGEHALVGLRIAAVAGYDEARTRECQSEHEGPKRKIGFEDVGESAFARNLMNGFFLLSFCQNSSRFIWHSGPMLIPKRLGRHPL